MTHRLSGFAVLLALAAANVVFGQSVQQIGEMANRSSSNYQCKNDNAHWRMETLSGCCMA